LLHFIGTIIGQRTIWEGLRYDDLYLDDGVSISFPLPYQLDQREAINYLKQHLPSKEREWLWYSGNKWQINLGIFKSQYEFEIDQILKSHDPDPNADPNVIHLDFRIPTKINVDIFSGTIDLLPEVSHRDVKKESRTTVKFTFTYEDMIMSRPKRIFLSHKSADKPIVRQFSEVLNTLGFQTWLDEDDLKAGDKLHRGILNGFKDSCAAIFFVTSNYQDEKFLATEIDYAITRANEDENFRIITLVLDDRNGITNVPDLLKQYVYKIPSSHLQAINEIIKALPLKLGDPNLR